MVVSFFVGIPSVIYLVVKLVTTNKQLVNLEANYKSEVNNFVQEMESQKN